MLSSPVYVNTEPRSAESHPRQPVSPAHLSCISFRRSQRFNVPTFQRFNDPRPNSLRCTFLATPHQLTPYPTISYKNHRGEGCTLSFTPFHQIPAAPLFSITYKLPIFYPLCFDIHPCNGGCTPLPRFLRELCALRVLCVNSGFSSGQERQTAAAHAPIHGQAATHSEERRKSQSLGCFQPRMDLGWIRLGL